MEFMINEVSYRNRTVHGSSLVKTAISEIRATSASIFRGKVNLSMSPEFYFLT